MTVYRPISREPDDRRLDRLIPDDFKHIEKYPLTAATMPERPVPVVIGVNWYSAFDRPQKDSSGRWWIARDGNLGQIRGGHCVALRDRGGRDYASWWTFYDQGREGACVGFGCSRMMTLMNRRRYDARWLYKESQKIDEWPGENYEGTSVRAGLDILRQRGHCVWRSGRASSEVIDEGIAANRWANSIDEVLQAAGYQGLDYMEILNSWGRNYPHIVRVPASVLARLLDEYGEFGLVTDR